VELTISNYLDILISMIKYSNHSGESIDQAVIITGADSHYESVMAEYKYIKKKFAKKGTQFTIAEQGILKNQKRHYDAIRIKFSDGAITTIFFDITESYDKFVIYPQ
jgi:hypothetical protein